MNANQIFQEKDKFDFLQHFNWFLQQTLVKRVKSGISFWINRIAKFKGIDANANHNFQERRIHLAWNTFRQTPVKCVLSLGLVLSIFGLISINEYFIKQG